MAHAKVWRCHLHNFIWLPWICNKVHDDDNSAVTHEIRSQAQVPVNMSTTIPFTPRRMKRRRKMQILVCGRRPHTSENGQQNIISGLQDIIFWIDIIYLSILSRPEDIHRPTLCSVGIAFFCSVLAQMFYVAARGTNSMAQYDIWRMLISEQ